MAYPAPSSLFDRMVNVWRDLSLRNDVDDLILEILGKFSLEKIYAESGDKGAYQRLIISLLSQLNAIFFIQRLSLPSDNVHVGRYLGLLVSWEVTVRCIELVLQVVNEGRDALWDCRGIRDMYLAKFLLGALRILTLHPRACATQRARDRRERFTRIHKALEQVFDSYPEDKSFLLLLCKEVTQQLCIDSNALSLPQKLRFELPNLTSELYPLEECLSSQYISEIVSSENPSSTWLYEILTLRDISQFIVGASIQYSANQETRDARLQSTSAKSRNAMLRALENIRLPPHLARTGLISSFNDAFRIILPDTLDLSAQGFFDHEITTDCELDALDSLGSRLVERQIVHRASDGEMMHGMSQVIREIVLQDNPSGHFGTSRPSLHVLNCSECHQVGGAELRAQNIQMPSNLDGRPYRLPPDSVCPVCGEDVSMTREVTIARRTWEVLRPLETDAETINVERHLPTHFEMQPSTSTAAASEEPYSPIRGTPGGKLTLQAPPADDITRTDSSQTMLSPLSAISNPFRSDRFRSESSMSVEKLERENNTVDASQEMTFGMASPLTFMIPEAKKPVTGSLTRRKSEPASDKPKSRWRLPFSSSKKSSTPAVTSADTDSISSGALETQKLDEVSLNSLAGHGAKSKSRASRTIHTCLSQNSTLGLFWSHTSIQVWDVGASPPLMLRGIYTDSTCILATVGKVHCAYVIGTRDQKLTLRIVNLVKPSTPVVEYRMPSSPWCRSIAIDLNENYVAVGFEESVVRFFKTANTERPREDRLHAHIHDDCKRCPPVDTLSFSADGLGLVASTRGFKTGVIQTYIWKFPFLSFQELTSCRYDVPLHESEDNGISSASLQSGAEGEDSLVCMTTWTQSGKPVLIQPRTGHRTYIRADAASKQGKVGNRIQCATFSPSGQELAVVNDKGHLYHITHLNSSPMDVRRVTNSKELTAKSPWFSMAFMNIGGDDAIVMAWADSAKMTGWVKKTPISSRHKKDVPTTPGLVYDIGADTKATPSLDPESSTAQEPVELAAEQVVRELDATPVSPIDDGRGTLGSSTTNLRGFFDHK